MKEITILEEFQSIIPPLTVEEYDGLEKSILEEGIRDSLVVWKDTIVDGHNRYEIAQKHNLEFKTINKEFDSIEQVKIWIIENQLSRRNLNKSQLAVMGLKYEKLFSIDAEKRMLVGKKELDMHVFCDEDPAQLFVQGQIDRCKEATNKHIKVLIDNKLEYKDPVIYFIQSENGGNIKIGVSRDVESRLKQLQTSNSEKLKVTNVIPGGFEKEKELHEKFKSINIEGEWFKATQKLAEMAKAIPIRKLTSFEQAGKVVGVSAEYIRMIKYIEKEKPELISEIMNGSLTLIDVYSKIIKEKRESDIQQQRVNIQEGNIELPKDKFEVVVIDPPWPYGVKFDPKGRRAASPYPEMGMNELKEINLPVTDDSILFLWTTHKFLKDGFDLMDNWGFDYKTTLVWNKEKMGMGHWFRMQVEFCLFGVKGNPFWDNTTEIDIITEARREHSRKPDKFYELVEKLCPGRKLDYFARNKREGWESFGNETDKF